MNQVTLQILERIPRTMRYRSAGTVTVPCTVERTFGEDAAIGRRQCQVKLLVQGAGYPAGHLLTVSSNQVRPSTDNLYLIEFYVRNTATGETGWAINFAWVFALSTAAAKAKLIERQGGRFDCVIQTTQQSDIVPLGGNLKLSVNLFIII